MILGAFAIAFHRILPILFPLIVYKNVCPFPVPSINCYEIFVVNLTDESKCSNVLFFYYGCVRNNSLFLSRENIRSYSLPSLCCCCCEVLWFEGFSPGSLEPLKVWCVQICILECSVLLSARKHRTQEHWERNKILVKISREMVRAGNYDFGIGRRKLSLETMVGVKADGIGWLVACLV